MPNKKVDILFLGDIVGKPGRKAVAKYIETIKEGKAQFPAFFNNVPDVIIGNGENASHGFGLTQRNYNGLLESGVDIITSGNHIWDKKDIFTYIDEAEKLIRPINYCDEVPGVGSRIFQINDKIQVGVINVLGNVFMNPVRQYLDIVRDEVKKMQYETPVIFIDFHAEATAEKISFAYFADSLGVSAMAGTHTHVQTSDEKIFENGMGYITDAGFCGATNSVIGMDVESSLKRFKTCLPQRYEIAADNAAHVNSVRFLVDADSGCCEKIYRDRFEIKISEDNIIMKG